MLCPAQANILLEEANLGMDIQKRLNKVTTVRVNPLQFTFKGLYHRQECLQWQANKWVSHLYLVLGGRASQVAPGAPVIQHILPNTLGFKSHVSSDTHRSSVQINSPCVSHENAVGLFV
jgi:hypothetical protein